MMKANLTILGLALLIAIGTPVTYFSQDHHKKVGDTEQANSMSKMMESSHHKMGMAYRKNINTLASALSEVSAGDEEFNAALVESMVMDLKRAFASLTSVHKDHMAKMKPEEKAEMAPMMEKMKNQMKELSDHIAALEASVSNDPIDRNQLGSHANAIAKLTSHGDMKMDHKEKMKMGEGMKGSETVNR